MRVSTVVLSAALAGNAAASPLLGLPNFSVQNLLCEKQFLWLGLCRNPPQPTQPNNPPKTTTAAAQTTTKGGVFITSSVVVPTTTAVVPTTTAVVPTTTAKAASTTAVVPTTTAKAASTTAAVQSTTAQAATSTTIAAAQSTSTTLATSILSTSTAQTSTLSTSTTSAAASTNSCIPPARTPLGTVQTGVEIWACTKPGSVALTFDDGPYQFTNDIVDELEAAQMKGTFFMNGDNWASINSYVSVVQRIDSLGHQVGSHTWKHADLGNSDDCTIATNLTKLEDAFMNILGKYPTYLRPPYLSMSARSNQIAGSLGYKVIQAGVDTKDYEHTADPQTAVNNFISGYEAADHTNSGSIVLEHDVYTTTDHTVVPGIIKYLQSKGLKSVTVGECLGESSQYWYATKAITSS